MKSAPKLGDIVVVNSDGLVGYRIRAVSRKGGEAPSRVNHSMIVVAENPCLVLDLQPPIVKVVSLYAAYGCDDGLTGDHVGIYRMKGLHDSQRYALAVRALKYCGCYYGFAKILLHRLNLENLCMWDRTPICSGAVGVTYEETVAYRFRGKPGRTLQPDDIDDEFLDPKTADRFECIHALAPLKRRTA